LGENIFSQLNTGLDYSRDIAIDWLASPLTLSTGVYIVGSNINKMLVIRLPIPEAHISIQAQL
jgi:hypothetical protein